MYKLKYRDLSIISNKKLSLIKNNKFKKLLIIPGLGCISKDYEFLLKSLNGIQIFIFKNPGHEGTICNLKNDYLLDYVKKIYCFLKHNNIQNFNIFCHSMSSIIFILLFRNFLKNKDKNCKFIIFEGNLTETDTSLVTQKTLSYTVKFFTEKGYENLLKKCALSKDLSIRNWTISLKMISAFDFYHYSKFVYKWSKNGNLISYFKKFFKKSIYIYGENSANIDLISKLGGQKKICIKNGNHFAYIYHRDIFKNIIKSFIDNR